MEYNNFFNFKFTIYNLKINQLVELIFTFVQYYIHHSVINTDNNNTVFPRLQ